MRVQTVVLSLAIGFAAAAQPAPPEGEMSPRDWYFGEALYYAQLNAKANFSRHSAGVTKSRHECRSAWSFFMNSFFPTGMTQKDSGTFSSVQIFRIAIKAGS